MSDLGHVVVFAKPPVAGQAKTRLIPAVGPEGSVTLASAFLADTWSMLGNTGAARVVGSTKRSAKALGLTRNDALWLQGSGDLGQRMERILRRCCGLGPWGIIIGADSPGLTESTVTHAMEALSDVDVVIVPSDDGGYALLGMRTVPAGILSDLPWSQAHTLNATVARFTEHGLTVRLVGGTFDVDTPSDLVALRDWLTAHPSDAPNTRAAMTELGLMSTVAVSVVIPTLNEAGCIERCLTNVLSIHGVDEVIVSDGGSTDGTLDRVRAFPSVRIVEGATGRGPQLNTGADAALGKTLLFLHADCTLPKDAVACIHGALADPDVAGGAFKLWTVPDTGARGSAWWMHIADVRSRYTRLPYGDQAQFCRRSAFQSAGGFPDLPILEDYALSKALWNHGRLVTVDRRVTASARRFEDRPLYYCALMNTFPLLYRVGIPADRLALMYKDIR
jgi:rSAM/selenodomain-associated transferase 2/rSAM/selenodomain-associated transferase 1